MTSVSEKRFALNVLERIAKKLTYVSHKRELMEIKEFVDRAILLAMKAIHIELKKIICENVFIYNKDVLREFVGQLGKLSNYTNTCLKNISKCLVITSENEVITDEKRKAMIIKEFVENLASIQIMNQDLSLILQIAISHKHKSLNEELQELEGLLETE
jgi:small nuclear ribonucleoprotein (snRNP)-like protein